MSEQSESDVINGLMKEIKTLTEDLSFERNLNKILENIRNNSLILIQNCECLTNQKTFKVIKKLNTIYTDLKTKHDFSEVIEVNEENDDNLESDPIDKKKRLRDKSIETEVIASKRSKPNENSNFNLITEMLRIKDKSHENDNNSETETETEFLTLDNSNGLEVIDCKPCLEPSIDSLPQTSTSSSLEVREAMSRSNELCIQSLDIIPQELKYNCSFCDQAFEEKISLQKHLSKTHKKKSFECDFCDYKTVRQHDLNRHNNSHLSLTRFQCQIRGCHKWFKVEDNLIRHNQQMH